MIDIATKVVLGPLLHLQAGRLRRSAVELPEPAGKRDGVAGAGAVRLRLLIAGDSSAAGVGARTQDDALAGHLSRELAALLGGAVRWQLVAQTGARSEDVLHLLKHGSVRKADVGIVVVGVNDIAKEVPLQQALRKRGDIAAFMRTRAGVKRVLFPGAARDGEVSGAAAAARVVRRAPRSSEQRRAGGVGRQEARRDARCDGWRA